MNRKIYTVIITSILSLSAYAQNKYIVFFPDKAGSGQVALSAEALEKRQAQGQPTDMLDKPVSRSYTRKLEERNIKVISTSRWLNAALVETAANKEVIQNLLPATRVEAVPRGVSNSRKFSRTGNAGMDAGSISKTTTSFNYGATLVQNSLLDIQHLHAQGYTGAGVTVLFLDAGYLGLDNAIGFDSVRMQGRLLGVRDFRDGDTNIYVDSDHGMLVSGLVAANLDGTYVGMAPHISMYLALTDDLVTETHADEFNYVAGLEWADSLGVDLVNASLSYFDFDTGVVDYVFADMDGKTTISAKGARIAAQKGILIVNGAGNSGGICTPCDVDTLLCVGGASPQKNYDGISSVGLTADGRIKPDVAAMTLFVNWIEPDGSTSSQFYGGTSSATPQVTGLVACLKQKYPAATNMQLLEAVRRSAHLYNTPNNAIGYGVPNARAADSLLSITTGVSAIAGIDAGVAIFPNPGNGVFDVKYQGNMDRISVFNALGQLVYSAVISPVVKDCTVSLPQAVPGVYTVQLSGPGQRRVARVVVSE